MHYLKLMAAIPLLLFVTACDNGSSNRVAAPSPSAVATSDGQVGTAIAAETLTVTSGGSAPFTWSVTSGSLPDGVSLSSGGELSGTPSAPGDFSFTLTVTDSGGRTGTVDGSISIIEAAPTASVIATTDGVIGVAATETLSIASGGAAPFDWAVTSGDLPTGLSLSSDGTLSGSPTTAGVFAFTVTVTDDNNQTGTIDGTITVIEAAPTLATSSLPSGREDDMYPTFRLTANGGTLPLTWSASGLPPGLSLSTDSIQGTPTAYQANPYSVSITVTDALGRTANADLDLTIDIPEFATAIAEQDFDGDGIWDDQIINTFSNETGRLIRQEWVGELRHDYRYNGAGFLIARDRYDTAGLRQSTVTFILNSDGTVNTEGTDLDIDGSFEFTTSYVYNTDGDLFLLLIDNDGDSTTDSLTQYAYQQPTFLLQEGRDDGADGSYEYIRDFSYPSAVSTRESSISITRTSAGVTTTDAIQVDWQDNPDGTVRRTATGDTGSDLINDWVEIQTVVRSGLDFNERRRLISEIDRDNGANTTIDVRVRRTFTALDQLLTETRDNDGDGIFEFSITKVFNTDDNVENVTWERDGVVLKVHRVTYDNWHIGRESRFDENAFATF